MIAVVAGVLLVAAAAFAVLTIVPPAVATLGAEVADGTTEAPIGSNGAAVVAPAGWVVSGAGTDEVVVRTPDGILGVRLRPGDGSPEDLLLAATTEAERTVGVDESTSPRSESLPTGDLLLHADVGDRALSGVVARDADAGDGVAFVAVVGSDATLDRYRAALAQLLDGIRA